MLKDNLMMLRRLNGFSQEEVAEKIGISRQAYGKWESGDTIPDVEKCAALASVYGVTVDSLLKTHSVENKMISPGPVGKHIFGTVIVSDRGQIVIPKEALDLFCLKSGTKLVVLGDEAEGIALIPAERFEKRMQEAMSFANHPGDKD